MEEREAFVEVVRRGSYTAASHALGVPKSTLSRRVANLEARLGIQLLTRTTRSVRPTEVGQAYFERVERLITALADAEADVGACSAEPRGTLRVTAPPNLGHIYVSTVVATYAAAWPEVRVELHLTDRVVHLVEEGFDVAIRAGTLAASSLTARRLGSTGPVLCASPAYLATAPPIDRIQDLTDHACLVHDGVAWGTRWPLAESLHVQVNARLTANSWDVLRDAALHHLGVVYIPEVFVSEDLRTGRLTHVLPGQAANPGGLWVVYPPSRYLTPKVRVFVDHLVAAFAETTTA